MDRPDYERIWREVAPRDFLLADRIEALLRSYERSRGRAPIGIVQRHDLEAQPQLGGGNSRADGVRL